MIILGIESSCDETAAAVVRDGVDVLSGVVNSQQEIHARFGGVVPEVACRSHVESVLPVIDEALCEAGMDLAQLDGVAVTTTPGLIGALLIGVTAAKALRTLCDPGIVSFILPSFFSLNLTAKNVFNPLFLMS